MEDTHITVIRPPRGWMSINFAEIWRYRDLFGFLVWRDILIKYKQAFLGISWALLAPLASTVVFTIIFGRLAKLPTGGMPASLFYMCGLILWRYFQQAVTFSSNSLVANKALLTKIYLPRLIIPAAAVLSNLVDFFISCGLLLGLLLWFGIWPTASFLFLPLFVLLAMLTALGTGLLFGALNVKYRDIGHVMPFLLQIWMYCSVIVPFSQFEAWIQKAGMGQYKYLAGLNPMIGLIEGFRWAIANHVASPDKVTNPFPLILVGLPVILILLLGGLYYFKRVEGQFADLA